MAALTCCQRAASPPACSARTPPSCTRNGCRGRGTAGMGSDVPGCIDACMHACRTHAPPECTHPQLHVGRQSVRHTVRELLLVAPHPQHDLPYTWYATPPCPLPTSTSFKHHPRSAPCQTSSTSPTCSAGRTGWCRTCCTAGGARCGPAALAPRPLSPRMWLHAFVVYVCVCVCICGVCVCVCACACACACERGRNGVNKAQSWIPLWPCSITPCTHPRTPRSYTGTEPLTATPPTAPVIRISPRAPCTLSALSKHGARRPLASRCSCCVASSSNCTSVSSTLSRCSATGTICTGAGVRAGLCALWRGPPGYHLNAPAAPSASAHVAVRHGRWKYYSIHHPPNKIRTLNTRTHPKHANAHSTHTRTHTYTHTHTHTWASASSYMRRDVSSLY